MTEDTARLKGVLDLLRKRFNREKERPNSVLNDQERDKIQDNIYDADDFLRQGRVGEAAIIVQGLTESLKNINGH